MDSPVAQRPQRSFRFPGSGYPAGRPQFYALRYQRQLLREGALMRLPPVAFAFLAVVVLEEDRNRYQSPASLFNDHLARSLGCSEDTVARTRAKLVEAGLLHYERAGDKQAAIYWVRELPHWEPMHRPADPAEQRTVRTDAGASAGASAEANAGASADRYYPIEDSSPTPAPGPTGWEVVIERLRKAEVALATEAAESARRSGFTPELALACIDWYLQQDRAAYGPGILLHRFRRADASHVPADQGWPPPNPAAVLRQTREREAERAAQARDQQAAAEAARESSRRQEEQLLLQWGDEIDRMDQGERVALVEHKGPWFVREVNRVANWRESPLVRAALLEAFAANHANN